MWNHLFGTMILTSFVFISACGNSDNRESTRVSTQEQFADRSAPEKIEGTNIVKPADQGLSVNLTFYVEDGNFKGPESTPAGWTNILLENRDQKDHHMGLIQLSNSKTVSDFKEFVKSNPRGTLPSWAIQSGGPADIGPGLTGSVIQNLEEGAYVLVNYELDENEIARVSTKMLRPFSVTKPDLKGSEPFPDVLLTIVDYGFNIVNTRDLTPGSSIDSGSRIIKITNSSEHVHEARFSEIAEGKQSTDFPDYFIRRSAPNTGGQQHGGVTRYLPFPVVKPDGTGPGGPPPGTSAGGVLGIQPGQSVYAVVDLNPGFYFLYDLLEDTEILSAYLMRPMLLEYPVR